MIYAPKPPLTYQLQKEWLQIFEASAVIREHRSRTLQKALMGYLEVPDFPIPRDFTEAEIQKAIAKPYFDAVQEANRNYEDSEKIVETLFRYGQMNGLVP